MIGMRLKKQREMAGLTQPQLAAAVGAAKRTIVDWEKGVTSPTGIQLSAMVQLGIDVSYILTGVPSDPAVLASWRAVVEHTQRADISTAARQRLMAMAGAGMAQPDAGAAPRSARHALGVAEPAHAYAATAGPDARLLSLLRRCSDTDQAMIRALIERLAKTEENDNVADVDDQRRR